MRDPGPREFSPLPLAAREQRTNRFMRAVCIVALAWSVVALGFVAWSWLV